VIGKRRNRRKWTAEVAATGRALDALLTAAAFIIHPASAARSQTGELS